MSFAFFVVNILYEPTHLLRPSLNLQGHHPSSNSSVAGSCSPPKKGNQYLPEHIVPVSHLGKQTDTGPQFHIIRISENPGGGLSFVLQQELTAFHQPRARYRMETLQRDGGRLVLSFIGLQLSCFGFYLPGSFAIRFHDRT